MRILLLSVPIIFVACGKSDNVVYKEVKVPVKCEVVDMPPPRYTGFLLQDLKNLIIFSKKLEKDLNFCRGLE